MKNKNKCIPETRINAYGESLQSLLNKLEVMGISPSEYSKLSFELDFLACYYESDTPSISLVGKVTKND